MIANLIVRPYKPSDYQGVRKICCDSADMGKPVENFFYDREVFADLLTRYYMDYEPQGLWVALQDGEIIGYLMSCNDSRSYFNIMAWWILPKVIIRSLLRGVFFHRQPWIILRAILKSYLIGGFRRNISLDSYPAHLHVNVKNGFRGQHVGKNLAEAFFAQASNKGIKGVHLAVRQDNLSACHFFEQLGFFVLGIYPIVMSEDNIFKMRDIVVYGKILQ